MTGPLFSSVPANLLPPLDGKSFFHYILVIRLPPLLSQVCNRLTKSIGRQSKACFVIEIHKIKIKLPFFNKFEPEPTLYIELSQHTFFDNLNNSSPHSVSIADFMVLLSNQLQLKTVALILHATIAMLGKHKITILENCTYFQSDLSKIDLYAQSKYFATNNDRK